MASEISCVSELPRCTSGLRVTTFNLLAPVWVQSSIYPSMDMSAFEPAKRRQAQRERILEMDSDIILMQECQKSELDLLLCGGDALLQAKYDFEFCPFPRTFWTNWLGSDREPCEHGVCVLTKKSVVKKHKAEHVSIDLPGWEDRFPQHSLGARACVVHATLAALGGERILILCSHLDADSVLRAGSQGLALAKKIKHIVDASDSIRTVIWGGDFNMEARCSAMKKIQAEGFQVASSALSRPTVFAVAGTVRVDHILCYVRKTGKACDSKMPQTLEPIATFVPPCPLGHRISILPFLSELQRLCCAVRGEDGLFMQTLLICLALIFLPLTLALASPLLAYFLERTKQCERLLWALSVWGSDHLPVTVCMGLENTTSELSPKVLSKSLALQKVQIQTCRTSHCKSLRMRRRCSLRGACTVMSSIALRRSSSFGANTYKLKKCDHRPGHRFQKCKLGKTPTISNPRYRGPKLHASWQC